jgi:predicted dehydrogenase
MSTRKVRIGQAGIANHGRTILDAIRDAGNLELVSCYDINTSAKESVAREFGARAATDYDDLVQDPSIDAVALVTPNHLHFEQLEKAVRARKHVFVEKPIANSIADACRMIRMMDESGLVLMVGHNTRRRRVFRRAKQILQEELIGKVALVEANLSRPAGLQPGLPPWKADPTKCALLPMMQLGIHLVDTISYLLGPFKSVSCFASTIAMEGAVYDSSAAILQLDSGVPVALTSSYVSADAYFLRIYGTEGTIHCAPTHLTLDLLENGELVDKRQEDFASEGAKSYILQMREFGECVLGGKRPETGGEEGLRALAVIEAMVRSIETRTVIELHSLLEQHEERSV